MHADMPCSIPLLQAIPESSTLRTGKPWEAVSCEDRVHSVWADVVTAALNEVRYGVVLLDRTLHALFINRAFHEMWALPPPPPGTTYTFRDLMEHGQQTAAYQVSPEDMRRYVEQRILLVQAGTQPPMQLPLADGRTLSFECIALPDGGRMLTYTDVTDHVHAMEQLRELATVDDLTKLLNRRQFLASLDAEYRRSVRSNADLSVLMIDADNFKQINDRHGHAAGDTVLRALAERCCSVLRKSDVVGRVGGEEFAAALAETDLQAGFETAERLRRLIERHPVELGGSPIPVTVSLGVAAREGKVVQPQELLKLADRALYEAKATGRNKVVAHRST
jgi:diguanylate cyclase (GGDEF)-like protein